MKAVAQVGNPEERADSAGVGMTVHRAERANTLVDALAEMYRGGGSDPFARTVIAVPARGMERWIAQRIADRCGIAANIEFPLLERMIWDAVDATTGSPHGRNPWGIDSLTWAVAAEFPEFRRSAAGEILDRHLRRREGRTVVTARRIAGYFDAYAYHRPALLRDWESGDRSSGEWAAGRDLDGLGGELPADQRWQAELYRRVSARIAVPSRAVRLPDAAAALRTDPNRIALPDTIHIFGATRISAAGLEVLGAIAEHRRVHLWLPHASPAMWDEVTRTGDDDILLTNSLLTVLGREVRQLQRRLEARGVGSVLHRAVPTDVAGESVLAGLHRSLALDEPAGGSGESTLDGSVEFHAAHGDARTVEVLRERILALLDDDATLAPRDIVIACPRVESLAPLIQAAFNQHPAAGRATADLHPGHGLRVRIADRALTATNDRLHAVLAAVQLCEGRVGIGELLDLCALPAVRERFAFSDSELEQLRRWGTASGARWGFDPSDRKRFRLDAFRMNTVQMGLDRILVGIAADESEPRFLGTTLPLDNVESNQVDLAGRFAELVDTLHRFAVAAAPSQDRFAWGQLLLGLLDDLTAGVEFEAQARGEIIRGFGADPEAGAGEEVRFGLPDARAALASRLEARATRANFHTGDLTVCSMVPMRSIPHRVVILLGLSDDSFPRRTRLDGDDILALSPQPGERDPRLEDRQLLLDALSSATERLLVFYSGADPVTGEPLPPAAPVGELIDAVSARCGGANPVTVHPLQPFDRRNFLAPHRSYDSAAFAGAQISEDPAREPGPLVPEPLEHRPTPQVVLDDLVAFVEHPVRAFLKQRVGITVGEPAPRISEAIPIEWDGLEKWELGERIVHGIIDAADSAVRDDRAPGVGIAGFDPGRFRAAEGLRGTLPPYALGSAIYDGVYRTATTIARLYLDTVGHGVPRSSLDTRVVLSDGQLVYGTVPDVVDTGNGWLLTRATYSSVSEKQLIRGWVRLCAVKASYPDQEVAAVLVGKYRDGADTRWLTAPADPFSALQRIANAAAKGLSSPLRLAPAAALRAAENWHRNAPGGEVTREQMHYAAALEAESAASLYEKFHEGDDPAIQFAFGATGSTVDFESLIGGDRSLFVRTAYRLHEPMLQHIVDRNPLEHKSKSIDPARAEDGS